MPSKNNQSVHTYQGESPQCIAVIGDIVDSRSVSGKRRFHLHLEFQRLLDEINANYAGAILSRFTITLGDEFQGLLHQPQVIPEILWDLEVQLPQIQVRIGIGNGVLTTPLRTHAIGMDGPAFHRARAAVQIAKSKKLLGGIFMGFDDPDERAMNGFARILYDHRSRWNNTQREVVSLLRNKKTQVEIAGLLQMTKQAISSRAGTAGWDAYEEAEEGWRALLTKFETREQWGASEL